MFKKWSLIQLQPFIDVYKRSRNQKCELAAPVKTEESNAHESTSVHIAALKKKVLFKRETDKTFGFLKIETSIKPESRLSKWYFSTNPPTSFLISEMRRMLKANIMGNAFDLSDKLIV